MDRSFRAEQLAKLHPDVAANAALNSITRELSLYEIAIMTRAAPARLLGLKDRGQLGAGRAADIAVYREDADREAMFTTPAYVFKDGALVARAGRITASPVGGTHFRRARLRPRHRDDAAQAPRGAGRRELRPARDRHDELCGCCNGGRLLPASCFEAQS
jgi:formylmethanofuran dehydrogenase subunit A